MTQQSDLTLCVHKDLLQLLGEESQGEAQELLREVFAVRLQIILLDC